MFSPSKKLDQELLLQVGEMIKQLVRSGETRLAEEYGEIYLSTQEKLRAFDYEAEDKRLEAFDQIFK